MTELRTSSTNELITHRDAAAKAYYRGESTVPDDVFDAITAELARRGVPEQVGHGTIRGKVRHLRPMLSLRKVHEVAELGGLLASAPGCRFTVEPKWDGLAVSIRYGKDGELDVAVTRGDGEYGDDITPAIREIFTAQGLPLTLDGTGEVRGEIVLRRSKFAALNAERRAAGESPFANPRNAASGMVARVARVTDGGKRGRTLSSVPQAYLDAAAAHAGRWLTFLAYDVSGAAEVLLTHALDGAERGFQHPHGLTRFAVFVLGLAGNEASIPAAVAWLDTHGDDLDVETDGVVVKLADPAVRERLGSSPTAPRWALAYKFPNRPKQTILRAVEWSETRTGRVVPTAVFDDIELAGANVRRATLNNIAFLEELDLRIGDTIEVTRANEVIPNVVRRIGDHPQDATAIPGPDGFPVGAGVLLQQVALNELDGGEVFPHLFTTIRTTIDGIQQDIIIDTWEDELVVSSARTVRVRECGGEGEVIDPSLLVEELFDRPIAEALDEWLAQRFAGVHDPGVRYLRDGRDLRHANTDTITARAQAISFAAERVGILGLGVGTVERLLDEHPEIADFPDLIDACFDDRLRPFDRATAKLVSKLTAAVANATTGRQDPAAWIAAAGVPGIGRRAGRKLVQAMIEHARRQPVPATPDGSTHPAAGVHGTPGVFTSPFDYLARLTREDLLTIDGFGDSIVDAIRRVDALNPIYRTWARKLAGSIEWNWTQPVSAEGRDDPQFGMLRDTPGEYVGGDAPPVPADGHAIAGRRVLVTGTLPTLSRREAEARIEQFGGTVASGVSKTVDLLIAGEKGGSKLAKAEALGIQVMDGGTFEGLSG